MKKTEKNTDFYISSQPAETQKILKKIRAFIRKGAPQATEDIKYGIPTFVLKNENLIHFASFKNHIGLYPTSSPIIKFKKELSKYKTSKGAIQFPLGEPLPFGLIEKILKFRIREVSKIK